MTNLHEQRMVIFGGTSGMGLATAKAASDFGATVVITGRSREKGEAAAASIGPKVRFVCQDAADPHSVQAGMKEIKQQMGEVEHVVLALSGSKGAGPLHEIDLNDLEEGFSAKVFAQLRILKACVPLLTPSGSVTFLSAITAQMSAPGTFGLAAINGAIESMIKPLAAELKPRRVNAVSPGVIDTPWWNWLGEEDKAAAFAQYAEQTCAGRVGTPDDVAEAVIYLSQATYLTGAVLPCDGGLRL